MIFGFLITLLALVLVAWLVLMLLWWKKEHGQEDVALSSAFFETYIQKVFRLVRRGWYRLQSYGMVALSWSNRKIAALFFKLFPSAIPAFAKPDETAGANGPSSHFLTSILQSRKRDEKKLAFQEKIVS
ncbi:MAG TPA: hypothetical protein VG982_01650 [Candidatus Paceibacterota bacterium]|jgi:hypothetical protein|nr:hypothetical protein [Candidatus Paceibacterota bacterium]